MPCLWTRLISSAITMPVFVARCHGFLVGRECLEMSRWVSDTHHKTSFPVIASIQEPEPGFFLTTSLGLRFCLLPHPLFGLTFAIRQIAKAVVEEVAILVLVH